MRAFASLTEVFGNMKKLFSLFKIKRENGQSMVEFALMLPLIVLLVCGVLEFGWVYGNSLAVQNATREGVRAGIVAVAQSENNLLVTNRIDSMIPDAAKNVHVSIVYSNPANFRAGDITVTVHYTLNGITPFAALFTDGGAFNLSTACTMKMS